MQLNLVETLALAAAGLWSGKLLCRWVPALHKLCLPEPVMGGLLLCGLLTGLESWKGSPLSFDTSLQTPLMIAFFLSIGWMASWKNLKRGGPAVLQFLLICSVVLLIQNGIGMGLAKALGQNPLLGVLAGSVSLTGGPGTALAFAPAFEKAGVVGAGPIGTACALAGIVLGGFLGAPLSSWLISRSGLRNSGPGQTTAAETSGEPQASQDDASHLGHLMTHLKFFLVVMALGALLGKWLQNQGVTLPIYIGAMLVAAIIRNAQDYRRTPHLSSDWIEEIGSISLSYFLVVATMTLQIRQLSGLAGVLLLIIAVQAMVVLLISRFVVFWMTGRDYDAALISGGFVGFMLGTTANAMANMDTVSRRFGPAPRAFLVVPLVGACFIDFVNAIVITFLTTT